MRAHLVRFFCFLAMAGMLATPEVARAAGALTITNNPNLGTYTTGIIQIQLNATGATGALTWSVSAGSLPTGLAIRTDIPSFFNNGSTAGIIGVAATGDGGTPYSFTLQVTDSTNATATLAVTLHVVTENFQDLNNLPDASANVPYDYAFTVLNGSAPAVTLSANSNALPTGLSIQTIGNVAHLKGTPTQSNQASSFNFQLQLVDGATTIFHNFNIKVTGPYINTAGLLPNGIQNTAYSQQLTGVGGSGGYGYQITNGQLPNGLSLGQSTGLISGTVANGAFLGRYAFTVTVTDSSTASYAQPFSLDVVGTPPIPPALQTNLLDDAAVGVPYAVSFSATGGTAPFIWNVTGLPTGMSFRSAGTSSSVIPGDVEIWGVPQSPGLFNNLTLTATDANGFSVSQAISLRVTPLIYLSANGANPSLTLNTLLSPSYPLRVLGGTGGYSTILQTPALPSGISANSSATGGTLSGTPVENGNFNFKLLFVDSTAVTPNTLTRSFNFSVAPNTVQINTSANLGIYQTSQNVSIGLNACCLGSNAYTWTVPTANGNALPAGLSLSGTTSNAQLSGSVTTPGTYSFFIQAADTSNLSSFGVRLFTVTFSPVTITTSQLTYGNIGSAYGPVQFTATGTSGAGSPQWSISSGYLPPGMSLSTGGLLGGTPTSTGQYSFTVSVVDGNNHTASSGYFIRVYANGAAPPVTINTLSALGAFTEGDLEYGLNASGGNGTTYTWTLTAGSLPTGLSIRADVSSFTSNTGAKAALIGVMTATGTYNFTLQVASATSMASQVFTMVVVARGMADNFNLPDGFVNSPYVPGTTPGYTLTPVNPGGALTFAVANNTNLPPGLSLNTSTGRISGTPTTAGNYNFNISLNDTTVTFTRNYSIRISNIQITTGPFGGNDTFGNVVQGATFNSQAIAATDAANGTVTFNVGGLPNGLTYSNGLITGTVNSNAGPGLYGVSVNASDGTNNTSKQFALNVVGSAAQLTRLNLNSISDPVVGDYYSTTVSVCCGGNAPFTWSASGLPAGLLLKYTGSGTAGTASGTLDGNTTPGFAQIYGIPTTAGNNPVTLTVTDGLGNTTRQTFNLHVSTIDETVGLNNGTIGQAYSQTLREVGATPGYTVSLASGALPAGVTLSATTVSGVTTAILSGTPIESGSFNFSLHFVDSASNTYDRFFFIAIANSTGANLQINTNNPLHSLVSGNPVNNFGLSACCTPGAYTWSIVGGALPSGLSLNTSTGAIAGTATPAGNYTFLAQVADTNSNSARKQFTLQISSLAITTASIPYGSLTAQYGGAGGFTLAASGGSGGNQWSLLPGSQLPPGLTLNQSSGVISGTPTSTGQYAPTFVVTDSSNDSTTASFQLNIYPAGGGPPLVITTGSGFGTFSEGEYQFELDATGATGQYAWSLLSGALPTGYAIRTDMPSFFSINASAGLIGVGTVPGTYSFTLQVTSGTQTVSKAFTITITALTTKEQSNLPDAYVGAAYNGSASGYTLTPLNPTPANATLTFTASPTTCAVNFPTSCVPPGLAMSSAGVLTGTPTSGSAGAYSFNVQLTDGTSTVNHQFNINTYAIQITNAGVLPNATQGSSYTAPALTATGGVLPLTWTSTGLPSGFALNSSTGVISASSNFNSGPGRFAVTVTATDSTTTPNAISSVKRFALDVIGEPSTLPALNINTANFDDATVGNAYSLSFGVSNGGAEPFTYTATGLPAGMSMRQALVSQTYNNYTSGDGELWGTATVAGTYNIVITATDTNGVTVSNTYPFKVANLTHDPNLPAGTTGIAYSANLRTVGGTGPYSVTQTIQGFLPDGLSRTALNVAGTPLENGGFNITYKYSDSAGTPNTLTHTDYFNIGDGAGTFQINNGGNLGTLSAGQSYSNQLNACCVPNAISWTTNNANLPSGIVLTTGGILSGTAPSVSTATTYTFLVDASEFVDGTIVKAANHAYRQFTLVVTPVTLTSVTNLPFGNVGVAYTQTFVTTGASGAVTWTVNPNSYLPPGLTVSGSTISGTPTASGHYSFTLTGTDTASNTIVRFFSIDIYLGSGGPPLSLNTNQNLGPWALGVQTVQLSASGGTPPYTYSLTPSATVVPGCRVQNGGPMPTNFSVGITGGYLCLVNTPGTYNTSIRVTDSASATFDRAVTVKVSPLLLGIQQVLPKATAGVAYTFDPSATNGVAAMGGGAAAYTFSASGLPDNTFSISSTGVITSTGPTAVGTFTFSITVGSADSSVIGPVTFNNFSITVNPFAITTPTILPQGTAGSAYSTTLTSTGCGAGCTWSVTNGTLPTNFSLNSSTGVLSTGNAVTAAPFVGSFTIQATKASCASNCSSQQVFTLVIAFPTAITSALTVTTNITSTSQLGSAASILLSAGGGIAPYTFALQSAPNTLPPGISLQGPGDQVGGNLAPGLQYLAGRPSAAGTYTFTVQVTDSTSGNALTATKQLTWTISELNIQYNNLPLTANTLILNNAYTQPLLVLGGSGSYTSWVNQLPMQPGLTVNSSTGVISGTPVNTGNLSIPFLITDSNGQFVNSNININVVSNASGSVLTLGGPASGTVVPLGSTQNFTITPSGGTGPYTITPVGTLPAGVLLESPATSTLGSSFGVNAYGMQTIFSTPGTYVFTLQATDSSSPILTAERTYTIIVPGIGPIPNSLLAPNQLIQGTVGVAYSQQLYAFDNSAFTWSLTAGSALPPGLTISAAGVLSGTPTAAGTFNFNLTVTDAISSITSNMTMRVSALAITTTGTTPGVLPLASINIPYGPGGAGVTLAATGGSGTTTWTLTAGTLPSGLSLSSAGVILGTPDGNSGIGFYAITVTATNTGGSISKQFTIFQGLQNPGVLDFPMYQAALPDAIQGQNYQFSLVPDGGIPGYTWTLAGASNLPPGLSLVPATVVNTNSGPGITALAGLPSTPGPYSFSLVLTDSTSATVTRTFSLNVTPISITVNNPRNAAQGSPYNFQFEATGGTAPYNYSLVANPSNPGRDPLPFGLTLSSAGLISGTPTGTGNSSFVLTVTDSAGHSLSRTLSIASVNSAGVQVTTNSGSIGVGSYLSQSLSVSGSSANYNWALLPVSPVPASPIVNALPAGLTLQSNSLTGILTTAGTYQFVLQATNSTNSADVALRTVTVKVTPISMTAPVQNGLFSPNLPVATVNSSYSFTFRAAGGTPPYTFAAAPSYPFPPGMTLNANTGVLSGTPMQSGAFVVRPIVTDAAGNTDINFQTTLIVTSATGKPAIESRQNVNVSDPAVGVPFAFPLDRTIYPGVAPFTWSVTSGALPTGLSLLHGSNGLSDIVAGTPIAAGSYNFTLHVVDSASQTLDFPGQLNVSPISISPGSIPNAVRGSSYSVALSLSGGTPPYSVTYAQYSGPPPGLSISPVGVLSGTPTYAGVFPIGLVITDHAGNTLNQFYDFSVDDAAGEVPSVSLAPKPLNILYLQGLGATLSTTVNINSSSAQLGFTPAIYGLPGTSLTALNTVTNASMTLNYGNLTPGTYSGFLGVTSSSAVNLIDTTPVAISVVAAPPCTYTLTNTATSSVTGGDSGNIEISAGAGCTWTAAPDGSSPWISLTGTIAGSGNGTVSYTTSANGTSNPRTGTVVVTGSTGTVTFTINQFAAAVCSFSINPSVISAGAGGASATVNVVASDSSCTWTASGLSAAPTGGTGSGSVSVTIPSTVSVSPPPLTATIANQTFTVNQTGTACTYNLSSASALFDATGGSGSVSMTAPNTCPYSTILGPSWINVTSGAAGTGSGNPIPLIFTVDPNSTTLSRTGALIIGGQAFAITEQALACSVSADTSTLGSPFAVGGGTGTIGIATNGSNCSWNAASNSSFATVTPATGFGNGTINVTTSSNAAVTTSRVGSLTVSGQTISFTQGGTTCNYSLRASSSSMPSLGGLGTVSVVAPSACTWTAVANANWLNIIAAGTGGTADVSFTAAANATALPRSGTLTVAGQTFTVNEAAAPCSFTLAASGSGTLASGGVTNSTVNYTATTTGCAVPTTSYSNWITISNNFSGDPNGTLTYSVAANVSGATRTGNVQIGDKVFTVSQSGAACAYSMNSYGISVNYVGASGSILGSANLGSCPNPPTGSTQPFVTTGILTGAPALYTLPFTVAPFPSATKTVRQGLITFGGQLFYVKQTSY